MKNKSFCSNQQANKALGAYGKENQIILTPIEILWNKA